MGHAGCSHKSPLRCGRWIAHHQRAAHPFQTFLLKNWAARSTWVGSHALRDLPAARRGPAAPLVPAHKEGDKSCFVVVKAVSVQARSQIPKSQRGVSECWIVSIPLCLALVWHQCNRGVALPVCGGVGARRRPTQCGVGPLFRGRGLPWLGSISAGFKPGLTAIREPAACNAGSVDAWQE